MKLQVMLQLLGVIYSIWDVAISSGDHNSSQRQWRLQTWVKVSCCFGWSDKHALGQQRLRCIHHRQHVQLILITVPVNLPSNIKNRQSEHKTNLTVRNFISTEIFWTLSCSFLQASLIWVERFFLFSAFFIESWSHRYVLKNDKAFKLLWGI